MLVKEFQTELLMEFSLLNTSYMSSPNIIDYCEQYKYLSAFCPSEIIFQGVVIYCFGLFLNLNR